MLHIHILFNQHRRHLILATYGFVNCYISTIKGTGKVVPLQAWSGPERSRKFRFPDFTTTAQDGGKVVSLTHRPLLPSENAPGTHFCQRLSRPQGYSAIRRILSIHWHVQNAVIPCRSQGPLPFHPVIHFFLPLLSANHSSILPHFVQPPTSQSTSWSYCFQIHTQYCFRNRIFLHSLYTSKLT